MVFSKKQQIRGIRILLTVTYGFLLSSILFRYIIHGIVETIRNPVGVYTISMIVIGIIVLISIGLATYATWFDNAIIMLVSGVVSIFFFIITLVFGVLRLMNARPYRVQRSETPTTIATYLQDSADSALVKRATTSDEITITSDKYALAEDVAKLIVELVAILFAILGAFVLHFYIKSKYASVPTSEPKPA